MKKYIISWETDYCDDFPERTGDEEIEANSQKEAEEKFYELKIPKAIINNVSEVKE